MPPKKLSNLKAAIYERGYTVTDFAKMMNINPKTFSSVLSGRFILSDERKVKIAEALGKSQGYLFGD